MSDNEKKSLADMIYEEGMAYNLQHDKSSASSALARATLARAATMGHTKAIREVSEMIFEGSGGTKDPEHGLWLKWAACVRGDFEALKEMSEMLENYAESMGEIDRQHAEIAARKAEEVSAGLIWLQRYLHELLHSKRAKDQT